MCWNWLVSNDLTDLVLRMKSFIFAHFRCFPCLLLASSNHPLLPLSLYRGGALSACHVCINKRMMTSLPFSVTIATPATNTKKTQLFSLLNLVFSILSFFLFPVHPTDRLKTHPPTIPPPLSTYLWESGCERALTIASTAVSNSSGSPRALKESCSKASLSLRGTSSSTQDDRHRSTRAFTAAGLSVLCRSCCSKGHTDPHSWPRAPRTCRENNNERLWLQECCLA